MYVYWVSSCVCVCGVLGECEVIACVEARGWSDEVHCCMCACWARSRRDAARHQAPWHVDAVRHSSLSYWRIGVAARVSGGTDMMRGMRCEGVGGGWRCRAMRRCLMSVGALGVRHEAKVGG